MIQRKEICLVLLLVLPSFLAFAAKAGRRARQEDEGTAESVRKICLQKRFYLHQYYLGCSPDYEEADTKKVCPYKFTCPRLEDPADNINQCHVDGQSYNSGERVPNDNKCRECFCGKADAKNNLPARVECSAIECKNVEPLRQTKEEECFYTFPKADSCCPTKKCIRRNTTATCEHQGQHFHNGQKIFPGENPCKVCLCNRQWDGLDGPTCAKIECDMRVERERLLEGCVPVYFQGSCCPESWVCPEQVSPLPDKAKADKCYFDGKEYNYGENLEKKYLSGPCIQCKCVVPNIFTCIREACPPLPRPKRGFQCVPKDNRGQCCPEFDCSKRIVDPCDRLRCHEDEKCIRLLENCKKPPCKDNAECVPRDFKPCDDYRCRENEVCLPHQFPCPARNCPVRAACLPIDPCTDEDKQCDKGTICRNVILPCLVPPCPKVAECVTNDPCKEHRCRAEHVCRNENAPDCQREPCPKDPICSSPNCPDASCDRNSIYQPFGKGKDNCPWCRPIPRRQQQRRRPQRRRRQ